MLVVVKGSLVEKLPSYEDLKRQKKGRSLVHGIVQERTSSVEE